VKIKIRPEYASMLQMNERLAGLRDGEGTRLDGPGYAEPRIATARGAAPPSSRDPGRAGRGYPPLSLAELEWHHDNLADEARPRWQIRGKPSRCVHSLVAALNPARAWRAYGGRQAARRQDREHSEDLMVLERARACSAGAMNSTRR
jgi:hypothetical protein